MRLDRLASGLEAALAAVSRTFAVIGGCAVLAMMLHVSADVLSKYLLNRPIVGTLEMVSHYYMVAAIFLPLAAIERARAHIIVELFTIRLGPRAILFLDAVACLLAAVFAGVITWMAGIEAIRRTRSGEMIDAVYYQILVWPTRWLVPAGALVFMLVLLLHALRFMAAATADEPPPPPRTMRDVEIDE
ncbi:MAG: TRAP transporter small permease [Alphaproteobacteria bacterium]